MLKHLFISMLAFCPAFLEAVETVIVPKSELPLKKSYLFSDKSRSELILFYEKLTKPSSTLFIERRRVGDRNVIQRFSLRLPPGETTRLADYVPGTSVLLALVQHNKSQAFSTLAINVLSKGVIRSPLFTIEEARRIDASLRRLSVAGMTWDIRANKESLLINATSEDSAVSFLAAIDNSGRRIGIPAPLDRRQVHTDLATNSCTSIMAATTATAIRILKANRRRSLITPEEISFDPELCQYAVIRRQFSEIPQIYFLDSSLNTQRFFDLPGAVAQGLIEDSRSQLNYSSERKSFYYPTVFDHAKLALNEITQSSVKSDVIATSVDSSSVSITAFGDQVFLLISGLRVRTFERVHQLILISTPPPSGIGSTR